MTTHDDSELSTWKGDWQAGDRLDAATRAAVARRVRRRRRNLALIVAGDIVAGLGGLVFAVYYALRRGHPGDVLVSVVIVLLIAAASGFAFWNRRGLWRPESESTRAFLDLSILRCRRSLVAVRFSWWLLAVETALMLVWLLAVVRPRADAAAPGPARWVHGLFLLAALAGVAAGFLLWYGRRMRREERSLGELRSLLGE